MGRELNAMAETTRIHPGQGTIICVDESRDSEPEGRLFQVGYPEPQPFSGVMQLIVLLERILSDRDSPAAAPSAVPMWEIADRRCKGRLATFSLRVLYCQHASWQGTLFWVEGRRTENIRSVPELLSLLISADLERP